jgi:hypothetical protein
VLYDGVYSGRNPNQRINGDFPEEGGDRMGSKKIKKIGEEEMRLKYLPNAD